MKDLLLPGLTDIEHRHPGIKLDLRVSPDRDCLEIGVWNKVLKRFYSEPLVTLAEFEKSDWKYEFVDRIERAIAAALERKED